MLGFDTNSVTFSINMAVWNRANMVERAINSVLSQNFKDYELILVDDGSTDNLKEVVQPYLSKNIRYYRIKHQGLSAARNYGLRHSTGKYIAYLDSDNTWHANFLLEMHQALQRDGSKDIAYCKQNYFQKDRKTGEIINIGIFGKSFVYKDLFAHNYIDNNSLVHKRDCIKEIGLYDTRLKRLSNWDFILRLTSKYTPVFVDKVLTDYYFGVAKNALSTTVNPIKPYLILKKKFNRKIRIVHDAILYNCENIPYTKYTNYVAMSSPKKNFTEFTAPGFPFMLQLEPTNKCNLKCSLCPTGRNKLNRKPRHMKLEEFISLIDDMREYLLFLVLWDWGEPFLNPELPDMIEYATNMGIKTVTSTNAQFLLDEEYVNRILKAGLSTLIVAIDSLKEDRYAVYRAGGELNKALLGVRNLIRIRNETNARTQINLRMVIGKQNEDELNAMRRLAQQLGVDWFSVKTLNPGYDFLNNDEKYVPENPKHRRYQYRKNSFERIRINASCGRIWFMSNILSNGDVVPCCYDYAADSKVGNINEQPLSKIWNGAAYRDLRKRVYYQKNAISKCRTCPINFQYSTGWFVEARAINTTLQNRLFSLALKFYHSSLLVQGAITRLQSSNAFFNRYFQRIKP